MQLQDPGTYRGTNNQVIYLPHDDPATFDRFIQWMRNMAIQLAPAEPSAARQDRYLQLAMLYVLGEKLGVPRLQNKVLDMFLATANFSTRNLPRELPREGIVRYVYQHTPAKAPLRKLLAVLFTNRSTINDWRNPVNQAKLVRLPDFAKDIVVAMAERLLRSIARLRDTPIDMRQFYHRV